MMAAMKQRPIPSSGEMLPVIGLGTYRGFDVGSNAAERAQLTEVLRLVLANENAMVDSSPMYGRAEDVSGALMAENGLRTHAFIATKVWTSGKDRGIAQMEKSFKYFRTDKIDLMQVHNLLDTRAHLDTLAGWKAEGRVRYVGVTHYHSGAFGELESAMRREKLDFVQLNYSLDDRAAEQRLFPLAQDKGIAMIVNVPFGGGSLLSDVSKEPLPAFAKEIGATSWAQVLLKFVLGHPAVTCTIPGTGNPKHMADNLAAADGDLASGRERILAWAKGRF